MRTLLITAMVGGLMACSPVVETETESSSRILDSNRIQPGTYGGRVSTYIDPDTQCQYLLFTYPGPAVAVTPKLNSQGSPICGSQSSSLRQPSLP